MKAFSLEKHILGIICSVFDAYSAVLFLPAEDGACRLSVSFSLGDTILPDCEIRPGKGLVGWILRNQQPVLVSNFEQHNRGLGYYSDDEDEERIKAFMGCPLLSGGALCVDSKRQYSFSEKDQKILQLFAELLTKHRAVQGELSFSGDISRYFAELGIILDLRFRYKRWADYLKNFLQTMIGATGFEYATFASVQTEGETFCVECESTPLLLQDEPLVLPMTNGSILGWVFSNEQPVISEDIEGAPASVLFGNLRDMPDFQAMMCFPITVNKTTRGVLCLAQSQPRQIDGDLRSFVQQAVEHLSLFLENLYLRTRLRSLMPQAQIHGDFH